MSSRAHRFRNDVLGAALVVAAAAAFFCIGITWGLPSAERNRLYFRSEQSLQEHIKAVSAYPVEQDAQSYAASRGDPSRPARSIYNAIRSYHPDEYFVLRILANVHPGAGRFDPGFYHIGGAFIYPCGAFLFFLWKLGLVNAVPDPAYYLAHPDELAAIYLAGRLLCAAFAAGTALVVYDLGRRLFSRSLGIVSAAVLITFPAFALNAHFLYNDVPAAFWVTLSLWAAVRFATDGKKRHYVIAFLSAGLAVGAKVSTALVVPAMLLGLCANAGSAAAAIRRGVVAVAGAVVVFAVTNPFAVWHAVAFARDVGSNAFVSPSLVPYGIIVAKAANPVFVVLALVGIGGVVRRREWRLGPLAAWAVLTFAGACLFGKRYARYLVPMLPALALLSVLPAWWLWRSKRTGLAILVVALPLAVSTAWCVSLLGNLTQTNTRTQAGLFIEGRIPLDASIAVTEDPWQYEMPPFDVMSYDTKIVGYDVDRLAEAGTDFFITSDVQRARSKGDDTPDRAAARFWERFDRLVREQQYEPFATFAPGEYLFDAATFPEDMRYHNPVIRIYSRRVE